MKGETELQRVKIDKDGQEKKQDQSSNIPRGADGRSQGKSPNRSKTTDNSLIQSEKQNKIVIQFKAKEIKHGKSTCTPDIVTTSRESHNKSNFDGTEGKRLWPTFAIQRNKVAKKKAEKHEFCKLKLKAERTVLEKSKSSVCGSHVPHKKAAGSKKWSEDARIPKKPSDTSAGAVHDGRPFTKKSNTLSRTWEEEYEEKYKAFSKKKRHAHKCTPSRYSPETQQWGYCKQKNQDADSDKASGNSGTEERDFEAAALCFKQNSEVPCMSDSYQEDEDIKSVQKSFEVFPPLQDSQNPETDQEMQIVEDLHVARVQKRMALSVVQTYGELTSMEIDLPEQDLSISAEAFTSGLNILVVIDTNIMISHLEFVRSLKSEDIPGVGRLALIIPWVVLQELDNLKKGKMLQHVRDKAIPAVQFIYTCLKNQDSKLWGQSMQLASQKTYGLSDENNDDRVLQCCLQYQNLFPQAVVILCTDDKNLCNKAIVSEVKAFCKADLVTALQNLNVNRHQNCVELQQSKCGAEFKKTERGDDSLTAQFPNVLPDLEKNLGEALSCILETEMKIAFGNLWMEILYLKPPWTLANLLKCYKKHWMAVFGYVVPRSLLSTIECLYKHLCTDKTVDSSTVGILLQESKKLLHAFSSRSDYNGVLPQAYAEVNKLYQTLTEVKSDSEQDLSEDTMVLSENAVCEKMEAITPNLQNREEKKSHPSFHVAQESRHQEIWSVLEAVWNTINLYSIEIFQKLDPNAVTLTAKSSFEEAFLGLQKLLAAVNDIHEGISRILTPTSSFQDIWTLYNFLISNEISNSIKFTAEELYECVSQEMYRERLEVGCCQLAQLEHTIKQCHASVHTEAKNRGWL
ncbi:transcriptional protein SWT1 isoform X2 [Egretta garzetta]|nr:transcriptional protein SWT1 isoform X2 [Egretta garzetta]XP_035748361.1 transcriptional protein SWT1 isoform X2 [Egretta garzetta]XP_035748362.1 transcriptional protein SWT1 isoform X2 [Egretta garzetta]XP_035748363.1 transcriptional protein SWT1 isoform X2 [Egretta garzetta]